MASNYKSGGRAEKVREGVVSESGLFYGDPDEPLEGVRCSRCHGSGLIEIQGHETDCIECEGFGSILN